MGVLIEGKWSTDWYDTKKSDGHFIREKANVRKWIENQENAEFPAEANRYHLFLSPACPWCHRVMIFLELKGLNEFISTSLVKPEMLENGWELEKKGDADFLRSDIKYIYQVYLESNNLHSGRATVPILWDKKSHTIVSNESSDIIRMLNTVFNRWAKTQQNYYPEEFQQQIESLNETIYEHINNGVYRCGFATRQEAYDKAVKSLFETLDNIDLRLNKQRYLLGDTLTESDWRLFPTLIRFDTVYYTHFKTNIRRISDYPNLFPYMLDLYQTAGIADTIDWYHIKRHYFYSHDTINPHRIVPAGPVIDFNQNHHRGEKFN